MPRSSSGHDRVLASPPSGRPSHADPRGHRWYAHWIAEGFSAIEATLVREGLAGDFCLGDCAAAPPAFARIAPDTPAAGF